MGLGQRIRRRFRESMAGVFGRVLSGMGMVSSSLNVPGLDRPAEHLVWIYLGMKARTEAISQVPLRISTPDGDMVDSGELFSLLDSPNSWMDGVQYFALIETYLALYDECEIAIVRGSARVGKPSELVPLNPKHIQPVVALHTPTGTRMPAGWKHVDPATGQMEVFSPEDVIPIITYSPYDATRSLGMAKPGRRAMQVDVLSQEQNLAIFKNGGMPDVVFETEQSWDKEQSEEFISRWQDRYGGAANAHKPGILYGGLKAKPLGLSPSDLQFFEGRRMSRQEQIALMRVKPAMVGLMEGETGLSQGSSTTEQKAAWWSETGLFELARIASAHQRFLVDRYDWGAATTSRELTRQERTARDAQFRRMRSFGTRAHSPAGLSLWFDEHEIEELMVQRLQKIDIAVKLFDYGWPPDDVSDYLALRLPPHPTNQPTIPFNRQPLLDLAPVPPPAPREARRESRLDKLFDELGETLAELPAHQREEEEPPPPLPAQLQRLRTAFDAMRIQREKAFARKWSRFFLEQRGRVMDRYEELLNQAGTREPPQLDDTDLTPGGLLDKLFPRSDEDSSLSARILPLMSQTLEDGFNFFAEHENTSGQELTFTIDDPRTMAALEKRKIQGTEVNATTEGKLLDLFREAFAEGDTTTQLSDRIDAFYKQNIGESAARPLTAARTQVSGIVNDGRMLAAREVGGLLKGWVHGAPEEARPHHVEAQARYQAKPIPLDQPFLLTSGARLDNPGDASAPIGETANCTCMTSFHAAPGEPA